MLGDHAMAEGALAAGCRFFGGYPITPSTEVAERMAERLPEIGGRYVQMEDELASMAVILGAAWTGAKVMTARIAHGRPLRAGAGQLADLDSPPGAANPCFRR
jgi:2-oxoglutarate ferredoxin oxidoreductase subunit alpha